MAETYTGFAKLPDGRLAALENIVHSLSKTRSETGSFGGAIFRHTFSRRGREAKTVVTEITLHKGPCLGSIWAASLSTDLDNCQIKSNAHAFDVIFSLV